MGRIQRENLCLWKFMEMQVKISLRSNEGKLFYLLINSIYNAHWAARTWTETWKHSSGSSSKKTTCLRICSYVVLHSQRSVHKAMELTVNHLLWLTKAVFQTKCNTHVRPPFSSKPCLLCCCSLLSNLSSTGLQFASLIY